MQEKRPEKPRLSIVVPCYNEEQGLPSTFDTLLKLITDMIIKGKIARDSYICAVDDGSKDGTWEVISKYYKKNPLHVKGVKFIRNYGNQKAIMAGLEESKKIGCDCAVSIDADLQQDENAIWTFVEKYKEGSEIVCGIRTDRATDSFFKKTTALMFYKVMNLLGVKIPPNHSDYRLVSKKALEILDRYTETHLFLRGFFHEVGLKTDYVKFNVKSRKFGTSKFSVYQLFALALNGITSFSIIPLRIIAILGFLTVIGSICLGVETIYEKYILHITPPGWATVVILLALFGGLQIFCLGIIGEYIGQVYSEVKARPRYILDEELK